jgi:GTP-binding protein HflX
MEQFIQKKAVCAGVRLPDTEESMFDSSMFELKELAETAGFIIAGKEIQNRTEPDSAFFIGKGKLSEIAEKYRDSADTIIFNHDISPSQIRNIERETGMSALTRTEIILGIFALHARSRAAKLQVEMARLVYQMPRIIGKGIEMSRIEGGIGMKGPGEQQLELDRRKIRYRIGLIKKELEKVARERENQRKRRSGTDMKIAIVGYTNSGKSTLLNRLTREKAEARNQLFVTLETTTRKMWLGGRYYALLTDTVGFIRDIPHDLVESFKSTFEDSLMSDLILHIVDISAPDFRNKMAVTEQTLREIRPDLPAVITVFNKSEMLTPEVLNRLKTGFPDAVFISAKTGLNIDALMDKLRSHFGIILDNQESGDGKDLN